MGKNDPRSVEKIGKSGAPCFAVCAGKHCAKAGTKHLLRAVRAELEAAGGDYQAELSECQDYCDDAPCITVLPEAYPYVGLNPERARQIVQAHTQRRGPLPEYMEKKARKRFKKRHEAA